MLFNGRTALRNAELVPKVLAPFRQYCSSSQDELIMKIPKKIERGPTDILKALASTVGTDPTAKPYKFPDDPFFYTTSNINKRALSLSIESGKKSAQWVISENPKFFENVLSEPAIEAFIPKTKKIGHCKIEPEHLVQEIKKRNVEEAVALYKHLKKKGRGNDIPSDVKQSLLELVCFYNGKNKPSIDLVESKWFANVKQDYLEVNSWEAAFAEKLFRQIGQKCPLANAAIIQGMIKYNNVKMAFEIYKKSKSRNMKFPLSVYNALLSQAGNANLDIGNTYEFIEELLKGMAAEELKPNIWTLNETLKALFKVYHTQKNESFVKKFVMELLHLGVEPSLGSYYYMLMLLSHKGGNIRNEKIIQELLDIIQSKKHKLVHPSDFKFFRSSMNFFATVLKNGSFVNQLHSILLQDDNIKFIENSFMESGYFRDYLIFIFKWEPLEIAMEKLKKVVPSLYSPEPNVFTIILKAIQENHSAEVFLQFWELVVKLNGNESFLLQLEVLPFVQMFEEEEVQKILHQVAVNVHENLEKHGYQGKGRQVLSLVLISYAKSKDIERMSKLYDKVREIGMSLLSSDCVMEMFKYALAEKKVPLMMELLKYAESEFFYEINQMAEMAMPFLSESDQVWAAQFISQNEENKEPTKNPKNETEVEA